MMKDVVAKSVFWIAWSRGGLQLVSFATTILVARLLSPTDYGLLAMAGVFTGVLLLLAELGLGTAVIQFSDLTESELNLCFWMTVGVGLAAFAALYVSAPWIARWLETPDVQDILRVSGLALPLLALRVVPDGLLRKRLEFDKLSRGEIAASVGALIATLSLAWWGFGVWALVAGILTQNVVMDVAVYRYVAWWPGVSVRSARLGELLRFSFATLGGRLAWAFYQQSDSFVLGKVSGDVILGLYTMAMQIAILPVTKVSVVVNQLAFPLMAGLQGDAAAMRAAFIRALRLVTCVTVPVAVGLAVVAEDLVRITLTDKWLGAVPILRVLALCSVLRSLEVLLPPVLFARYRASFVFRWTIAVLCVMPVAFWAAAGWRDALGVALAWLVVYPVLAFWMVREGLGELGIGWRTLYAQVRPVGMATVAMAVVVALIGLGMPVTDNLHRLTRLVASTVVGALVYALTIYWGGGTLVRELGEVFGWILRRGHPMPAVK